MTRYWKSLGVSLLALLGTLAASAPAAQANWLLLVNGVSVGKIQLLVTREGGYFLAESGTKIYCENATGVAEASLSAEKTLLGGKATVTFKGCQDEGFGKTCTIHSAGQSSGTIVATGVGDIEMEAGGPAETVWIKAAGSGGAFTEIIYEGAKCPLNEAEESVSGTLKITVLEALADKKLHEIHIQGEGLRLGTVKAETHMLDSVTKVSLPILLGSVTEVQGRTFAFHLVNL